MLKKMYLTNFLSFKERTEFDFSASKYSILSKTNVYDNEILKGALFLGPNASGKSNALKGISFIIDMIKGEGTAFQKYRCIFSDNPITTVEYEIEHNFKENSISENIKIDNITVLNRKGNKGELRIGGNIIVDEHVDAETLFFRTASFNTVDFLKSQRLENLWIFYKIHILLMDIIEEHHMESL